MSEFDREEAAEALADEYLDGHTAVYGETIHEGSEALEELCRSQPDQVGKALHEFVVMAMHMGAPVLAASDLITALKGGLAVLFESSPSGLDKVIADAQQAVDDDLGEARDRPRTEWR